MFSDKDWARIHGQLLPSFTRVVKGEHTVSAQKVCFEVGGVQTEQMHAVYMSPEVWAKCVLPALERHDKEKKIKTVLAP